MTLFLFSENAVPALQAPSITLPSTLPEPVSGLHLSPYSVPHLGRKHPCNFFFKVWGRALLVRTFFPNELRIFTGLVGTCCVTGDRILCDKCNGEYSFKHQAHWVFLPSPSSGERTQWVPLSPYLCAKAKSLSFYLFAELTEYAQQTQWGLSSETVLSKQEVKKQETRQNTQ